MQQISNTTSKVTITLLDEILLYIFIFIIIYLTHFHISFRVILGVGVASNNPFGPTILWWQVSSLESNTLDRVRKLPKKTKLLKEVK